MMYGNSVFSMIFAITERSEMGLYDVLMFMSLFGFWYCYDVCQFPCVWDDVLIL